jgi:tRNA threonylcarbamoyladenosine biosynthesis protein TsaB
MLLAIDTSTSWTGLALYDGSSVLGEICWTTHNHHTVELAPAVSRLLQQTGISANKIECIGVALGPGSFTSLRIGLALAKGMALSLKIPVVGVPTLDFLAAAQPVSDIPLAALLQAGRGRLALAWYTAKNARWQANGDPTVTNAEAILEQIEQPTWVCGELSSEERHVLSKKRKLIHLASPAQSMRRPSFLAELAWENWKDGKTAEIVSLAPIYLHIAEAIPS